MRSLNFHFASLHVYEFSLQTMNSLGVYHTQQRRSRPKNFAYNVSVRDITDDQLNRLVGMIVRVLRGYSHPLRQDYNRWLITAESSDWSYDVPNEPGFYWVQQSSLLYPEIAQVYSYLGVLGAEILEAQDGCWKPLISETYYGCRWLGPITVPSGEEPWK